MAFPDEGQRLALEAVLRPGGLRAVVQPIVRLADGLFVGYEALARVAGGEPPDALLRRAQAEGRRGDIEIAILRAAATLGPPPDGRLLFVSVGPGLLDDARLREVIDRLPERLVLEITQDQPMTDESWLADHLAPLLARGVRLAIDDTGSGYASLPHVVNLRPDFLKLSARLVSGLDQDPARLALVRALAAFAREVGSSIVAVGVERETERVALLAAGVDHAQGCLFAAPGPVWPQLTGRPSVHAVPALIVSTAEPQPWPDALDTCADARAGAEAVVTQLARHPHWMPSVYLHSGGRLRLQAQHGYWQVFDGMPTSVGVMGRTFRCGIVAWLPDVGADPDFVGAVPALVSELCVPLRLGREVVGVLNLESAVRLPDSAVGEVLAAAEQLGRLLERVGLPEETRARLLGRRTAALTALAACGDLGTLNTQVAQTVREVAGTEAALYAGRELGSPADSPIVGHAAAGPIAGALARLDEATLLAIGAGVANGATSFTAGTNGGLASVTQEALRAAGVRTVITVPVAGGGLLIAADRRVLTVNAEDVQLLELLATQVASCLQTVSAVRALRDQAERDPLTGLGHRAAFASALKGSGDGLLAVVYADVDHFKQVNDTRGHAAGDRVLLAVAEALASVTRASGDGLYRLGGDEFAAVARVRDEASARQLAERLWKAVRDLPDEVTVSVGVTTATPQDTVIQVLERADAALYDAKSLGRDRVAVRLFRTSA